MAAIKALRVFLTFAPFVLDDSSVDILDSDFYPIRCVQVRCNRQWQSPIRLCNEMHIINYS